MDGSGDPTNVDSPSGGPTNQSSHLEIPPTRVPINGFMCGVVAKHLTDRPDAHVMTLEMLDYERDGFDGVRVTLVDCPLVTTGKNAGRPNWKARSNEQARLISDDELQAGARAWRDRTGLCPSCMGEGRDWLGWNHETGTRFRPCPKCNGTGSADGVTVAESRRTEMHEPIR